MKNTPSFCYFTNKIDFGSDDDYKSKYINDEEKLMKENKQIFDYAKELIEKTKKKLKNNEEEHNFLEDNNYEEKKDHSKTFIPQSRSDFESQRIQYPKYSLTISPYISPVKVKSPSQRFRERWSIIDHELPKHHITNYTDSDADIFDFSDDVSSNNSILNLPNKKIKKQSNKKANDIDNNNDNKQDYFQYNEPSSFFFNGSPNSTFSKHSQDLSPMQNKNNKYSDLSYQNTSSTIIQTSKFQIQDQPNESQNLSKISKLRKDFEDDFPPSISMMKNKNYSSKSKKSDNQLIIIIEEEEDINDISLPNDIKKNVGKEDTNLKNQYTIDENIISSSMENEANEKAKSKNLSVFDDSNKKNFIQKETQDISHPQEEEENENQMIANINKEKQVEEKITNSINISTGNESKHSNHDFNSIEEESENESQFNISNPNMSYLEEDKEETELIADVENIYPEDENEADIISSDFSLSQNKDNSSKESNRLEQSETNNIQIEEESENEMQINSSEIIQKEEGNGNDDENEGENQSEDENEEENQSEVENEEENQNEYENEEENQNEVEELQINTDHNEEEEIKIDIDDIKSFVNDNEEEEECNVSAILNQFQYDQYEEENENELNIDNSKDDTLPDKKSKESFSFTTPKLPKGGDSLLESSGLESNLMHFSDGNDK